MNQNSVWTKAQNVKLQVHEKIKSGFDIGFDKRVSKEVEEELRSFVKWIECNYSIPITLWVDFEYKHYLIDKNGKRVGYLFYWDEFSSYPVFEEKGTIPSIRLPVRTKYSTIEEILCSFIEGIFDYYAWICNEIYDDYPIVETEVEEILHKYLVYRGIFILG